ncbi:hypothetical protein Tco_0428392 [Tanacetum coccineum]
MRRAGKCFSGRDTPLFQTVVVQDQAEMGQDEVVYKELDDSLVRAATTASSLEAEHDNEFLLSRQQRPLKSNEIDSLKRRVKRLEKNKRSRTHRLKRLYKVGLSARVESSRDEEYLGDDASKQGMINAILLDRRHYPG